MKKFLLSLMAILSVFSVHAADVQFTWAKQTDWTLDATAGTAELVSGDYTIHAEKSVGASAPTVNDATLDFRAYASNTVTITANGKEFTRIVFTLSAAGKKRMGEMTVDKGELAYDEGYTTVTWSGEATNEIVITVGEKSASYASQANKAQQFCFDSPVVITEAVPPVMIETDLTADFPLDWQGWSGATGFVGWAAPQVTTNDGRTTAACEQYNEGTIGQTGVVFSRTLTGLANGTYDIELYGAAAFTPGRSCSSTLEEGDETAVYLYAETPAGKVQQFIPAHVADNFNGSGIATAKLQGVVVTDGTIVIGMYKEQGLTNWHVVQIKGVTAVVKADDLLAAAVAKAEAITEADVPAALYTEIQNVLTENNKAYETAAEYEAAIAAIDAVVAKATPYAPLAAALAKGEAIKANVSDEAAKTAYDEAIAEVKTAFDAVSVTDFNAAVATVNAALLPLIKAQTADNSDMTALVENTAWTCDQGNGPGGYTSPTGKTATETYNNTDYNTGRIMYQRIEGLPMGNYEVQFYATLNSCWVGSAAGDGIAQVFANDAVYDIPVIEQGSCEPSDYLRTLNAVVGEDGVLEYGVQNIATGGNWCVAKAISLKLVKAITDVNDVYYAKALAAIKDGQKYSVFTMVGDAKYYLTKDGTLVTNPENAPFFTFTKVKGAQYEYGFKLADAYFTNPGLNGNDAVLNSGKINTNGSARDTWEAQVFFLKDGKYAVRATNAAGGESSWALTAKAFWTVNEGPVAEYSFDQNFIWELEEFADPRVDAFEKVKTWPAKLQKIEGLVQDASKYTSNAKESTEGGYADLIDNNTDTYFHSSWSAGIGADHYLQAEITEPVSDFYIYFVKRTPYGNNNNNRPTDIVITAGNDVDNLGNVTEINEGLPTGATPVDYVSDKISMSDANKFIRFTVLDTNNQATESTGHKFFTFSEFYILPSNEVTDAAIPFIKANDYTELAEGDVATIDALDEQINALVAQKELENEVNALYDLVDKLQAKIDATDTYTDETNAAATATAALTDIKGAVYTTIEAIEAASAQVITTGKTFFGAIKAVKDIDITDYFIVTPTPVVNKGMAAGWEGENFGDASNGVSEYWNKSGATFHQTISLPAGDYRLEAVALQRTDMTGYVYAGDTQVQIANVEKTTADSRAQAATWFDAGNGVNKVNFTMEAAGAIEIGLKADETTGDHWTVWREFKLILPGFIMDQEINVERYTGMGYGATTFEPDFTEALAFLGIENVTDATLTFINPDDTEVTPTFGDGTPDGWCDAAGTLIGWGGDSKICVKFNIAEANYMVCDMNGADVLGTTYTVKYALSANSKKVVYTINVTFVAAPVKFLEDYTEKAAIDVNLYPTADNAAYEAVLSDEYQESAVSELIGEAWDAIYGVGAKVDDKATLTDVYSCDPAPGFWCLADGTADVWANSTFGVSLIFSEDYSTFHFSAWTKAGLTDAVSTTFYLVNESTKEYVAYNVILNAVTTAINNVEATETGKAVIYDLSGRRVEKAQKGIFIINGKKVAVK